MLLLLSSTILWCQLAVIRDRTELLQETQLVGAPPMLHDLPLNYPIHVLGRDRDGLASWRDILKLARLGAVKGRTKGNGIPFGNHLLHGDLPVRKGRVKAADKAFEGYRVKGQIVADVMVAQQFLKDGQVLLVDHLVIETAD